MSQIVEFLHSLDNIELSFLYTYKYQSYMDHSQSIIKNEIDKRGLSTQKIEEYIKQTASNLENTGCPRCNSNKIISQQVEFTNTDKYTGLDGLAGNVSYTSIRDCAVCGYNLHDGNEKPAGDIGFLGFFLRMFKKRVLKK